MAELAELPSSFLGAMSVAVTPPRQDGIPTFQSDAQNQGLSCFREEMVTFDSKIEKRISPLQVRTVLEETLSELGPSGSLASIRTASTELYVPPHSKDESPQNGCVPNFRNDLQNAPQTSPLQKVEDFTRDKKRRPDSIKGNHKKRKRSQTKLATVDVEAAIASVVSVAEAVVVGQLMDASTLSFGHDRSIIMEAALSIGKARQSCGLDRYNLSTSTEDSDNLAMQDLDDKSMQEAYADVGMIVDVLEDDRQLLGVGPDMVNLYQRNTKVGATATYTSETAGNFQLAEGASTIEISDPAKIDGLELENKVKQPPPSFTSVAAVSFDPEGEIGGIVAGNQEINVGDSQWDIEGPQEMDSAVMKSKTAGLSTIEVIQCQGEVEAPDILVSTTSRRLEGEPSQLDGETITKCINVPTDTINSTEEVYRRPKDKSDERVAQAPEAELVTKNMSPNSDMFCGDFLLRLDSVVGGIQDQAEHQEEVHAEDGIAIDVATENKGTQSLESRELHPELSLPSKARASAESKGSYPDAGKNPANTKDPPMDNSTTNFVTPYVSRWFGGWSGDAELNPSALVTAKGNAEGTRCLPTSLNDIGSEDAVPERNAFLARQKSTHCGLETLISNRVSVDEVEVECLPQNDEATSEKPGSDSSQLKGSHAHASHMSQIDPFCSFVPCSISSPATPSLLPCQRDHQSSMLAATVEACVRTAMNIIDNRKVADCQQEGQAAELGSVPDPGVRTDNETSVQQIPQARRDSASPAVTRNAIVKRRPTLMKKLSTTTNSLSLLLHAVDIAEDCIMEGDDLERASTRFPNLILRSPPLDYDHPEGVQAEVEHSTDCGTQSTPDMPDATPNASRKGVPKEKRMHSPDLWVCSNLSDSPPLLWPRGKKRRLTACRVIDSDSNEWLHDDADDHHMAQEDLHDMEHSLQNVIQQLERPALRTSTRNNKPCHDAKTLFSGLQFLLTGFSSQMKENLSKSVERHGGELLADVPTFAPKQRFKRRGADCGAKSPPIVIAPQEMRTHKYLYGCAVGSPLLNERWISASVSALKCLPYPQYQHKQTRAGGLLLTENGGVSKSSESPLFAGFQFLFHGQQVSISQLSTLAKHAGGKVIRKLVLNASEQKRGQKPFGLVVVERSSNLPVELQRAASELEWQVVDAEWVVVSLLNGKLLPFATQSTPPSSVLLTQQSSASNTGEPLLRYSRRRIRLQSENLESRGNGDSRIKLLVNKLKDRPPPEENRPNCSSVRAKPAGKERDDQGYINTCWLGKGFTSPPQVPQLAVRTLGPYSHSLDHKKLPKKFLYYKAVLCNGLEYSLGDIVEVRTSTADAPRSVARIEGLWSEEGGRLPQTRAFQQGVRKMAFKNVILKCRRFFRPSDTGFPGKQDSNGSNELYLSNDIDNSISASDIVRRVRVNLETAGQVVHCDNWYNDDATIDDGQGNAGPLPGSHKKVELQLKGLEDWLNSINLERWDESTIDGLGDNIYSKRILAY